MKFPKEFMQDVVWGYSDEDVEVVLDALIGSSRWSLNYKLVFKYKGKYYQTYYSKGATEQQDEKPFEYDKEVDCLEVEPVKITVTDYVPVIKKKDKK